MTNKQLGIIALCGAPSMFIGVNVEHSLNQFKDSWFTGAWGIVYMTAWMCSLIVLYRMRVAGEGFGKWLIRIMFFTITIANISNIIQILIPSKDPSYFFYIDLFWPLSHLLMLVLGITVLFNKSVDKYIKIILFCAGLWLPIALVSMMIFGKTTPVVFYPGLYNALLWSLMAYIAIKQHGKPQYAMA
jgi:hypothetical protein